MTGFLAVLGAAFAAQLAALPGEKGQMIVASLSTRYEPVPVVAGASTAFGLWTAVEIVVGSALLDAFPEAVLDGVTAVLFVVFAAWLILTTRSDDAATEGDAVADGDPDGVTGGEPDAPSDRSSTRTDGGTLLGPRTAAIEARAPAALSGFLPAFSLMIFGEFGDKTQLVTIGLAAQYGITSAIWFGEMAAIVPVSLATALVADRTAVTLDADWIHYLAAVLFLAFAADVAASYLLGVSLLPL